jgi:hypothetical protein
MPCPNKEINTMAANPIIVRLASFAEALETCQKIASAALRQLAQTKRRPKPPSC